MNFTIGILNGTTFYNVKNFEICRSTIDKYWVNESMTAYNDFVNKSIFAGLFNIWDVLYSSDIVAHTCYSGIEELTV